MRSQCRALFALAASMMLTDRVCAEDGVWISQVSLTGMARTAAPSSRGQFDALIAAGRAFHLGGAEQNLQTVTSAVPSVERRIDQSGEGNWIIGVLAASASSVRMEQSGSGNGIAIEQDRYHHQLTAIQAGLGNDMMLTQSGDSHRLAATQTGQQNAMTLQQRGNNNNIAALQAGAMNTMSVVQGSYGNQFTGSQR
ncbi:hypothetical protein MPAR168_23375 [Methylorubrum populi]|uniref:Curlin associated repeat protein n=2 Tax=Hyphomicrobiales TaxID=356 RepID=A0ABU7TGU7_9HYPH